MRIGMICRYDNSGLGSLSWEFARHLKPTKVLLMENGVFQTFPERYAEFDTIVAKARGDINAKSAAWLADGVDIIISFETFYSFSVIAEARKRGVKTALVTMYEMTPDRLHLYPDAFICPSPLDLKVFKEQFAGAPSYYLPIPVATDRLHWKERTAAREFVHTASHGGMNGRKGTSLFIEAMRHVKEDVRFTIYSWRHFFCEDKRAEVKVVNFKNYWQAWREGDVLVYPQDYNGISLPCLEAFASGLGVITTDIEPFGDWLPQRLLVKHDGLRKTRAASGLIEVDAATIDPVKFAAKIDLVAKTGVAAESLMGRKHAMVNSWERLLPSYLETLEKICATS